MSGGRFLGVAGLTALLVAAPPGVREGAAQERTGGAIRVRVVGAPRVGKEAPQVEAPYVTREGPGPADQPFRLSAELGRAVVILIGAEDPFLRELGARAGTGMPGIQVAVLVREEVARAAEHAAALDTPFKLLADPQGEIHRSFGGRDAGGRGGATAWVVNSLGSIEAKLEGMVAGDADRMARLETMARAAAAR